MNTSPPIPGPPGTALRSILVVDDDPPILRSLRSLLSEHYTVDVAGGGAQALTKVATSHYDLILLDLFMAEPDGAAVIQRMREMGLTTPILLMSAATELPRLAGELGVSECIAKPFHIDVLEETVERLIRAGDTLT